MGEASVLNAAPHGENQNINSIMNHKQNLHNIHTYIYIYMAKTQVESYSTRLWRNSTKAMTIMLCTGIEAFLMWGSD